MFAVRRQGFTLIEILVVVGIISVLSGTVIFFASGASRAGRDADRQADLRALQAAVEAYKRDTGSYPAGCNGANNWSGEAGTAHACSNASTQYIVGLVPQYIRVLPRDPNTQPCINRIDINGVAQADDCGYAYITNSTQDVYKIIAMNTVESMNVTPDHPLASCDISSRPSLDIRRSAGGDGWCGSILTGSVVTQTETTPGHQCNINSERFQKSFAVWGGIAALVRSCDSGNRCLEPTTDPLIDPLENFNRDIVSPSESAYRSLRVRAIRNTIAIICR